MEVTEVARRCCVFVTESPNAGLPPPSQVIQTVFFGVCVLTDLSSLLTKGSENRDQEQQLRKLISLRDWMMAVLAFPVGVVSVFPTVASRWR